MHGMKKPISLFKEAKAEVDISSFLEEERRT
jgi:hypothetical protein